MTGKKIGFIVAGVVVVAAIAAGLSAESAGVEAYGEIAIAGEMLPRYEPGVQDPAAGMVAPTITGDALSVVPGGTPKVVLFLAHWCPACRAEVPAISEWVEANGAPAGVELIAVATSSSPSQANFPPSVWLEREGFPFPVIYDDEDSTAAIAYGLSGFPYWVVLDSDGRVVQRFTGQLPDAAALSQLFSTAAGL